MNKSLRLAAMVVGGLMVALGFVWILQGVNILPGSFMTGQVQWAIYGAVLALLGVGLVFWVKLRQA
jgi:divalent metal cation (Fe/Co/Zn/Cd) transporter